MKILSKILSLTILSICLTCGEKSQSIYYINSYHTGYGSSDDIKAGIFEVLAPTGIDVTLFEMDTKRNNDQSYIQYISQKVLNDIEEKKPDVIIASDDNAVEYIISPYFKHGPIPVVFCGVNWSCEQYGLPTDNVTGMLEVLPLEQALSTLKRIYPKSVKLTILSENTISEQNNKKILDPLYRQFGFEPSYALVNNYQEWKQEFRNANINADLIFFVTNGAIRNWDAIAAKKLVHNTITKPIFTGDDFMMDYAVFGFTKVAKEQGIWAAQTAVKIVGGASPKDIPVEKNKKTKIYINKILAKKINFSKYDVIDSEFTEPE